MTKTFLRPEEEFLKHVKYSFSDLIERGVLEVVSSDYDRAAFGNARVELVSRTFRVIVTRDRGDVYAYFAPLAAIGSQYLIGIFRLLEALGVELSETAQVSRSASKSASLITKYFAEIETGLSDARLPQTLKRVEELRAEWLRDQQSKSDEIRRRNPGKTSDDYAAEARERLAKTPKWMKDVLGIKY